MNRISLWLTLIASLVGAGFTVEAADTTTNGLIGYWNFNEPDGSRVMDHSGGNHHGVLRGATRVAVEKFGMALECQRNALVEIPHAASLDQFSAGLTVAAWVNRRTNSSWNTVLSREVQAGTSEYFGLAVVKNKALFSIDPDGAHYQNIKSVEDVPVGEWVHLAGTYDNVEFKLYVNGRLVKTSPGTGPFVFRDQNPLLLGGNSNDQGQSWLDCFHGKIAEVHLFNRALNPTEMATLFKAVPAQQDSARN